MEAQDQDFDLSEFEDINQAVDEWDDDDSEDGEAEEGPAAPPEKESPEPKEPELDAATLKRQAHGFRGEMLKERGARQEAQARYEEAQKRLEELERIDAAIERDAKDEEEEVSLAEDPSAYFDHRFTSLRDEVGRKLQEFQQRQAHERAVEEHRASLSRWQGEVLSWAQQRREALAQEAGVGSFDEIENKLVDLAVKIRQGSTHDADPAEIRAFAQHQMTQIAAAAIRAGQDPFATMVHQARAFGLLQAPPQAGPQPAGQKAPPSSGAAAARNRRAATAAPVGQGAGQPGLSGEEIANMPLDERLRNTQGLDPSSFFDLIALG